MLFRPTRITLNTSDVIDPVLESYLSIIMEEDEQSSDNYPQDKGSENYPDENANDKPKEETDTDKAKNNTQDNKKVKDKSFFQNLLDKIKEFFSKILKFFKNTPENLNEIKDKLPENITLKINNEESGKKTVGYLILLNDNYNKLDEYLSNIERISTLYNRIKGTTENNDLAGLHDEYKELSNRHNEFQEYFKNEIIGKVQVDKEYSFPSTKIQSNLNNLIQKNTQTIQTNGDSNHSQSLSNGEEISDRDKLLIDILKLYQASDTFIFGLTQQVTNILQRAANGGNKPSANGTSEEDAYLLKEGKIDGNIDGYNTVAVSNKKFPYAKQNANKEMQEKFGVRIIVLDRNIFNKLKSATKQFALNHEVGHIKQYEKNEHEGRTLEIQEGEADIYAVKTLGWNKKKLQAAYDDITRVSGDPDINENQEAVKAQFVSRMNYVTKELGI